MKDLSVIVPILNEAGNLEELIGRIRKSTDNVQMIFVDDGSGDGSREILAEMSANSQDITNVFNDKRLGHMGSYLEGLKVAESQNIVIMDGDLQHPPEALPEFLFAMQRGYNIVIGTRYLAHRFIGHRKISRGIISRGAEFILKIAVQPCRGISDPVSGFIGFNRDIVIPVNYNMKGNKLLPFLIVANEGAKIGYVPFKFQEREKGESKIVSGGTGFIWNFLEEVKDILKIASQYGRL